MDFGKWNRVDFSPLFVLAKFTNGIARITHMFVDFIVDLFMFYV